VLGLCRVVLDRLEHTLHDGVSEDALQKYEQIDQRER
jgi:hypothetical protein